MENNLDVNNKLNIADKFFICWSFFIPITTVILIPSIKMSVLSSIFAYISPFLVILYLKKVRKKYFYDLVKFAYIYMLFVIISQFSNSIIYISLNNVTLVPSNQEISVNVFRYTLINQTLYILPGILTLYYVKYFYNKKWDKWIVYSGLFFAIYALYKWGYFIIFGEEGDFLTNKVYNDFNKEELGGSGYLFQLINIGGVVMQRVQGLSGEPSMYAFTILPYFIFAIQKKVNKLYIFIIGISMVLSMSTTIYIGMVLYFMILCLYGKIKKKYLILFILLNVIVYIIFKDFIDDIVKYMIIDKLFYTQNSLSGEDRSFALFNSFYYWLDLDIIHMLFGIGYGYIRSLDFFTTLLVNVGLIGTIIFCYFILKEIKWKTSLFEEINNNAIIMCLFVSLMIAVPEVWFPSFWLFIGIVKNVNIKNKYFDS